MIPQDYVLQLGVSTQFKSFAPIETQFITKSIFQFKLTTILSNLYRLCFYSDINQVNNCSPFLVNMNRLSIEDNVFIVYQNRECLAKPKKSVRILK